MGAALGRAELKNELAADLIRYCGELRLRVTGSSMLPAIRPGDVLLVRRCRIEESGLGDVVLFTRHRRLFAHRVVLRSGARLITQGDGIAAADPSVSAAELLGKVVEVWRRGKSLQTRSKQTFCQRMTALLVRRSARAGRLLTRLHSLQIRADS